MRVLQRAHDRIVVLEAGGAVVRKEFTGPAASVEAAHEYECLLRFNAALGSHGRIRCPRPIELSTGAQAFVRMERAAGESLITELRYRCWSHAELYQLADALAEAVQTYVEIFGEPYFDFHLRNMSYEAALGRVWLFDFGVPSTLPPVVVRELRELAPLEVSVGNLVGSVIFEATRPRTVFQWRRHRQSLVLAEAVRTRVPAASVAVNRVMRFVWDSAAASGDRKARLWYRLVGKLLRQRMERAETVIP